METDEVIIAQTEKWIKEVVIACNFCPFALPEVKKGSVRYVVSHIPSTAAQLEQLYIEMLLLDDDELVTTTLVIYPSAMEDFNFYLNFHGLAEDDLLAHQYDGIYQLASFHPEYTFADAPLDDAANYTNRSPYPMIHILRESSIDEALDRYGNPDDIPAANMAFARKKGAAYMQQLRDSCF